MIVFKSFLKVLNKCKMPIIIFTAILILFGASNMKTSDNSTAFVQSKPDVAIINNDENIGITKDLINYISENSCINEIENDEDKLNDALFYRDVSYIIYIPKNFRQDFLQGKNPEIQVKNVGDYEGSLGEMILERYIRVANIYLSEFPQEDALIQNINETLEKQTEVEVTSKLDENKISKLIYFYNFANYSLLAGGIYVICLILYSFNNENIRKRTIISSMNYKKYNRNLLLSNSVFMIALWLVYIVLAYILLGDIVFSNHGLICIINSFVFSMCALSIAFLIGNLVSNKNAITGIVNVIALGSSFLCGCFVPVEYLPKSVLAIAHILPSYWYIRTNNLLRGTEIFNFENLKPMMVNMMIIIFFMIMFVVITNVISKKKRKLG